jgi:4-amino-4-deoxy-L-arabinose transferase-like glycosyltransferase
MLSSARADAPRHQSLLLAGFFLAAFLVHLPTMAQYGWFRDELYYLASTRHLDWGYVEHPPLSIALLAGWTALFGSSLVAVRSLAALAGALAVLLAGLLARRMGGGHFAQALAALSVLVAPVYLGLHHDFSMNAFETLLWTLAGYLLLGALESGRRRDWLGLGVVMGLGLLNKVSVSWLAAGLLVGVLAAPQRRALLTPWPWAALGIAALIFSPHLAWQAAHGWPVREFVHNATTIKMEPTPPGRFVAQQVLGMNPLTLPIWLTGLLYALFAQGGRRWRALGVAYAVVFAILIASGTSRPNYLSPAYPMLLAPGAVVLERLFARRRWRWLAPTSVALLLASGAALAPLGMPLLPVESYVRYATALGLAPRTDERQRMGVRPQHFADMFGWDELVATVARVHRSLPPAERAQAAIFVQNYGEAGAIDVLGRRRGLPHALSGHNSYWLWGPRGATGQVTIILGGDPQENAAAFDSLTVADTVRCRYCMPYENDRPVYVGRGIKVPLTELWPRLKHYI